MVARAYWFQANGGAVVLVVLGVPDIDFCLPAVGQAQLASGESARNAVACLTCSPGYLRPDRLTGFASAQERNLSRTCQANLRTNCARPASVMRRVAGRATGRTDRSAYPRQAGRRYQRSCR